MTKRLHAYDYELIDKLMYTNKPYAVKCAHMLKDKYIPKVYGYRALVECLIQLEKQLEDANQTIVHMKQIEQPIYQIKIPEGSTLCQLD